jgi:1-phosphatidylinositol phosphodiesterase
MEKEHNTFGLLDHASLRSMKRPSKISSRDPKKWMFYLDDETPLSGLTIPGTHDSAAYTYSWPFVATQKLDILSQLNAGIRYFDFRCGLRDDIAEMVHGITWLGMTLESVLNTMYDWLQRHPSEGLLVQIKEDRNSDHSNVDFAHAISSIVSRKSKCWRTASTPCSLGELRGRIQLFRRFIGPDRFAYGLDVTRWVDNPKRPFTICTTHGVRITIQDHYSFPHGTTLAALVTQKGGNVSELLRMASNDTNVHNWYLNFTSAYELNVLYQINPHQVAVGSYWGFHWVDGINVRLRAYLCEERKNVKRYGVVAMDFPEQGADDLITALILKNFDHDDKSWARPALLLVVLVAIMLAALILGCHFFLWAFASNYA